MLCGLVWALLDLVSVVWFCFGLILLHFLGGNGGEQCFCVVFVCCLGFPPIFCSFFPLALVLELHLITVMPQSGGVRKTFPLQDFHRRLVTVTYEILMNSFVLRTSNKNSS